MNAPTCPAFDGVLFFPVTPFTETGEVDLDALARHIASGVDAGPGGVFIACGTGEFHALEPQEFGPVVRTAVEVVAGRVPVYAGAGGSVAQAKQFAKAAKDAGADGLLLLPPYLVEMPQAGLVAYVRDVAAATDLPVIVYNRNNARFTEASAIAVSKIPNVIGFKDGTGDLDKVARIVRAVTDAGQRQGLPVLQRHAHRRDHPAGLPCHRRAAVLVGDVRLRARPRARVLRRARDRQRRTGQRPAAGVLPPARPAARHGARLRGVARQGRRHDGGHTGRAGAAAADHAVADDLAELRSIIAAGRAVLAEALTEAR